MITTIEKRFARFYAEAGGVALTFFHGLEQLRLGRRDVIRLIRQMVRVGWDTVPLALMIGLFTGMTVALGTGIALVRYGQENLVAGIVSASMIKEMGPVFTAIIIAARVGAGITAEIGTMAVNEEISVLQVLGIRAERYLVMPRVFAGLIMTPALTAYSIAIGLLGGAIVTTVYFDVSWTTYWNGTFRYTSQSDLVKGLFKGVVFGAIYSSVCCYKGLITTGGADGVGKSTTSAVVLSLSGILIANYLLTRYLYG